LNTVLSVTYENIHDLVLCPYYRGYNVTDKGKVKSELAFN